MKIKTGQSLASVTDSTTVIVIKASPDTEVSLTCGGAEMTDTALTGDVQAIVEGHDGGTQLGKRYVDVAESVEVLCTKGGSGLLALDGTPLSIKAAKALPSSD